MTNRSQDRFSIDQCPLFPEERQQKYATTESRTQCSAVVEAESPLGGPSVLSLNSVKVAVRSA